MEVEQAMQESSKAKPLRPRSSMDPKRLTALSDAPCVDADVDANPYHMDITAVVPVVTQRDKLSLSSGSNRALRRQYVMGDVEPTCALEKEKLHQQSAAFSSLMMLVLTKSTLYWLNLTWNCSMPNKRALLLSHVNNWANEVRPSISSSTPQNSAASDSQTGGKSHPPSSTVPSLTTKATSVSSAASAIAPAYRETMAPAVIAFPQSEDEGDAQDPAVEDVNSTPVPTTLPVRLWVAGHHQPHKVVEHTTSMNVNPSTSNDDFDRPISNVVAQMGSKCRHEGYNNSQYVTTSNVDDMDDERSNTGDGMTAKAPHVTAMTNVIAEKPAKKPCTSLCGDVMAEGSGHLAPVTTITGQALSTGTNSMGSGCIHYINGHLPHLLQEGRKWMKLVLPALVTWAGSLGDPWVILDQDFMQAL
ncbi:hypothetical protein F5141DRAFT_1060285 [Pisolithus sp. B1]|nr:hypothetical protein F5141DRAFT_1060285 [Pisolithus sp. B1]